MPNPAFDNHLSDVLQQKVHAHGWIYFIHPSIHPSNDDTGTPFPEEETFRRDLASIIVPRRAVRRNTPKTIHCSAVRRACRALPRRPGRSSPPSCRSSRNSSSRPSRRTRRSGSVPARFAVCNSLSVETSAPIRIFVYSYIRIFVYSHIRIHRWSMGISSIIWKDSSASAATDQRPRARRKNTPTARE